MSYAYHWAVLATWMPQAQVVPQGGNYRALRSQQPVSLKLGPAPGTSGRWACFAYCKEAYKDGALGIHGLAGAQA